MAACNSTMVMEPAILTTRANPKTNLAPGRSHSLLHLPGIVWSLFLWEQQAVTQACLLQSEGNVVVIKCGYFLDHFEPFNYIDEYLDIDLCVQSTVLWKNVKES
ncbi:hypothetical protein VNO77_25622 [Canavalia gladiata]|uniref:Uncharacterized protein n=1 Tax=Canavalia gladiata TaxID=3824 RepID=A0AAN9QH96_CANGL